MFLIRAAFWLTLVIAFIPVHPQDLDEGQRAVSTGETIVAAQALLSDFARFCERNPETCVTGRELFSQFGAKAVTGARELYAYLSEKQGDAKSPEPEAEVVSTGSVKANP